MTFQVNHDRDGGDVILTLSGDLDAAGAGELRDAISTHADPTPTRLVLQVGDLAYMASAGLRTLVFARQKMGDGVQIVLVGTQPMVRETLELSGFQHSVTMVDTLE
jgi:anti-anti-sigma factor